MAVPPNELLWRQYHLHIDLYKHYLDLTLKLNAFYYAITGGILSFYFSRMDVSTLRWALVFPLIMSALLAGGSIYGAIINRISRQDVQQLTGQLGFRVWPEIRVLTVFLWISAVMFLVVAAGLAWLFFYSHVLLPMERPR